jgi:hypothetical protein
MMSPSGAKRLAVGAAGLAFAALTAVAAAQSTAPAPSAGLPPERQANGIAYVTGGVSEDEASAFRQARSSYPLSVELVQQKDGRSQFTADADVRVLDGAGKAVLEARADGPFMLLRLPPGQYRVQATLNGRTVESKPVAVSAGRSAQATLSFPSTPD